jgi:hypothetical protein
MIVPQYWAECRLQQRDGRKTRTVRRWGWSDDSQAAAQAMADQRAAEAMAQVAAGEKINRRERKRAYNGADGVPIREEIVARHGQAIVTRNSYGALCLNSPDVLFIDIDETASPGCAWCMTVFVLGAAAPILVWPSAKAALLVLLALLCGGIAVVFAAPAVFRLWKQVRGGFEAITRRRIKRFLGKRPDWQLRLYRTPAGIRLLAMHQVFDPRSSAVTECFSAVGADPVYVRMCLNQNCFRARISPKPWRIGISRHLRPRPGVWPIAPERLADRQAWIAAYEPVAARFASCQFVEALGSRTEHPKVQDVQRLHDEFCRADARLPLA